MDEQEFRRLLGLFPVVRPRDYHAELDSSRQSTSHSASNKERNDWQDAWNYVENNKMENQEIDLHDKFWQKLKLTAERKVLIQGLPIGDEDGYKFLISIGDGMIKITGDG